MAQPPTNFPASSPDVRSKSRYKILEPRITDKVNRTNWTGMTCVASKRCNARFTYLICMTAVKTRVATSKYVTGKVMARHKVYDSMEATPLVDRAV